MKTSGSGSTSYISSKDYKATMFQIILSFLLMDPLTESFTPMYTNGKEHGRP